MRQICIAIVSFSFTLLVFVLISRPILYAQNPNTVLTSRQPSTCLKAEDIPVYTFKIVNVYPHDKNAFTQGLVFDEGVLYEGTGLRGQSSLRRVELETGNILQILRLPDQYFGEGVTVFNGRIIQLTWMARIGFVYDKESFGLLNKFNYQTEEGWGITHDGNRLIVSDGTSVIRFWDPETFKELGQIQVYDNNGPVENVNELEYVKGEIYANIWKTNRIARIAPDIGKVKGWIDLEGLYNPEGPTRSVDALNGIAYDPKNDRLFVTGKLWPKLFEIKLVEP